LLPPVLKDLHAQHNKAGFFFFLLFLWFDLADPLWLSAILLFVFVSKAGLSLFFPVFKGKNE
jgi:hypothetical protein